MARYYVYELQYDDQKKLHTVESYLAHSQKKIDEIRTQLVERLIALKHSNVSVHYIGESSFTGGWKHGTLALKL